MANNIKITGNDLKGLKKYMEDILAHPNPGVKVGVLNGATYSEGPLAGEYVAQNLARHEFGTAGMPARAPFRSTIKREKGNWKKAISAYFKASSGKINLKATLIQAGDLMGMDIQQSFEKGLEPVLKTATIKQKMRITREGARSGKYGKGRKKGEYKEGDYAANAATPVVLTGISQRSIKSEYVEDISTIQKG